MIFFDGTKSPGLNEAAVMLGVARRTIQTKYLILSSLIRLDRCTPRPDAPAPREARLRLRAVIARSRAGNANDSERDDTPPTREHYGSRAGTPRLRAGNATTPSGTTRLQPGNTTAPEPEHHASEPEHYDSEPERYGSRAGTLRLPSRNTTAPEPERYGSEPEHYGSEPEHYGSRAGACSEI
jgi:hypothetical protein